MSNNQVSDKLPLIFDLDGTLIDSRPEIIQTYKTVFQKVVPPSPPDFDQMDFGATIQSFLEKIYGNDPLKIEAARSLFVSMYDNSTFEHTPLYETVYETLYKLTERTHKLYLVTNKRYTPTVRILDRKKIAIFFSDVMASQMILGIIPSKEEMIAGLKRKHSINSGYLIGDTATDIKAGKKHNLITVAVTYGYETGNLEDQNPDYIINSLKELENLVS